MVLGRLLFHRGLPAAVPTSREVSFELKIGTEFNELIDNVKISEYQITVNCIEADSPQSMLKQLKCQSYSRVTCLIKAKKSGIIAQVTLKDLPDYSYAYLLISCGDSESDILPLLSDRMCLSPSLSSSSSLPLLSNYRLFPVLPTHPYIIVKESYGELLGAHLYDCSLVMLPHLTTTILPQLLKFLDRGQNQAKRVSVVELGAGCGLLTVFLHALLSFVSVSPAPPSHQPPPHPNPLSIPLSISPSLPIPLLSFESFPSLTCLNNGCEVDIISTDLSPQLPLLRHNILLNTPSHAASLRVDVEVVEYDWREESHFCHLIHRLSLPSLAPSPPVILLAADILYSPLSFTPLLRLLLSLGEDREVFICIAQKCRETSLSKGVDEYQREYEEESRRIMEEGGKKRKESQAREGKRLQRVVWECIESRWEVNIWVVHIE